MEILNILEYAIYIIVLLGAMYHAHRIGEKSGSLYMLEYLRTNNYKDASGADVPFLNDTGFNRFMAHMRKEKMEKEL